MSRPVTPEERAVVELGTSRVRTVESGYWKNPENRNSPELAVKYLSDLIRVRAHAGDRTGAMAAIAECRSAIAALERTPAIFRNCRMDIADFLVDVLQPSASGDALLRFIPTGKPAPRFRSVAARLKAFADDFHDMIAPAANWLTGTGPVSAVEDADLGIVVRYSLLCSDTKEESDFYGTIIETLSTTQRLAKQAGLKLVAIPDLAFGLLERRPDHILAYHTAGLLPNFTHFKRGDLPGFMVLDRGGYSGWSSLSGAALADLDLPSLDAAEVTRNRLWTTVVGGNLSKYPQNDLTGTEEPLPPSYVFVPMQVEQDRTQALARIDMYTMLDIVVARFQGTDTKVVVKPHPKAGGMEHWARVLVLAEQQSVVLRFDSIHTLIAGAEAVITVNSGVGSEAMLHGKPIYCFGAADYDPIAHRIDSAEQFADLTTPIRAAVSPDELTRFIAYYRDCYLVERAIPGRMDAAVQTRVIDPILATRSQA